MTKKALLEMERREQTLDGRKVFDRAKVGIETQIYAQTNDGFLICAGVHWFPEISAKWIYKAQAHWRRWRKWYDNRPYNVKRNYPAKVHALRANKAQLVTAFPVRNPEQGRWFTVPAA